MALEHRDIKLVQAIFVDFGNGPEYDHDDNVFLKTPGTGVNGIPVWNQATDTLQTCLLGTNLSFDAGSNTLNVTVPAGFTVAAPSVNNPLTIGNPGTAFQPRSGGPCHVIVNASLTGVLGLNETVTVQMSATQNGTYTTVAQDVLLIGVLGLTLDRSMASIPVPAGYWLRVNRSGSAATANYTKFDIN